MKRDIAVIMFSCLLVNTVSSQSSPQFAEGIIVKKTRDSLKCFVELLQGYAAEVRYKLEANGNLKTIYGGDECLAHWEPVDSLGPESWRGQRPLTKTEQLR